MAIYFLRNSLNTDKVVSCTITLRQIINKGEDGEPVWLIEVATKEPHKDGTGDILPEYIHYTSDTNLDTAIRETTEIIAAQVDWEVTATDFRAPYVTYHEPYQGTAGIYSGVFVSIKDILPTAGIDMDSIEVTINGIDVTEELEIKGDPYEYNIRWWPKIRVLDYY